MVVAITKKDVLKNDQPYILHFYLKEWYIFREVCLLCPEYVGELSPLQFPAEKKSFSIPSSVGPQDSSMEEAFGILE